MSDLHFLSACEQSALIRSRALSPVNLIRVCLERIQRYDGALRAYITVCGEQSPIQYTDFTVLANLGIEPSAIAVRTESRIKSGRELFDAA